MNATAPEAYHKPDTDQSSRAALAASTIALWLLMLHRNTPHKTRCRRPAGAVSCSRYASQAIGEHGLVKGLGMAMVYLADCGR